MSDELRKLREKVQDNQLTREDRDALVKYLVNEELLIAIKDEQYKKLCDIAKDQAKLQAEFEHEKEKLDEMTGENSRCKKWRNWSVGIAIVLISAVALGTAYYMGGYQGDKTFKAETNSSLRTQK